MADDEWGKFEDEDGETIVAVGIDAASESEDENGGEKKDG